MPLRILLAVLVALVGPTSPAWATGPQFGPMSGGSGGGVTANSCTVPGDFATGIAADGTLTCSTPAGSGDITAVGDCATGACFDGTTGNSLTFEGATADTIETILTAADPTASDKTITLPNASGTVAVSATSPLALSAAGDLSITADGIGSSQLAATFTATTITSNLVGNVTGNADTATALAANPTDCGADTYATTIAASGNLTCSTVTNAGLAGSIAMSKTLLTADAGLVLSTNSLATASSETGFITGSTSLPGTCGEGAVYQDTDSGGTETYTCTAANTWTKYVAATDNVATATALAADPADCSSNQFANAINASGTLSCSALTLAGAQFANQGTTTTVLHGNAAGNPSWGAIVSADITDGTITAADTALTGGVGVDINTNDIVADLTEIDSPTWSNGGSASLTHTWNLSGTDPVLTLQSGAFNLTGNTLIGATASGGDLTLQSTSNATRGSIFFGSEWEWLDQIPDGDDSTSYSGGYWAPTLSLNGAAGTASYSFGLDMNPTMNLGDAAGTIVPIFGAVRGRGTYTRSGAGTYVPSFYLFLANPVLTSATNGLPPPNGTTFFDQAQYTYTSTGATTSTLGVGTSFSGAPTFQTNGGASTRLDVTNVFGYRWAPTFTETTGTLNIATSTGMQISDAAVSGTTPQITTYIGLDVAALSSATTNIGIRNADTTVYTSGATRTLAAAGNTISASATFVEIDNSTGASLTLTSTPTIADGQDGQMLILMNVDSADSIVLKDISTSATSNLQLAGSADLTLGPTDSVTLLYSSALGDWIQIGASNN